MCEVPNKVPKETDCSEKCADFRKTLTRSPVLDECCFRFFGESSFIRASVPYYDDLGDAKCDLDAGERSSAVLHALYDSVEVLEMFPDEAANARIFGNCFVRSIGLDISCRRTFEGNIVDIRNRDMRDFRLQDESDVVVEDRDGVGPTHREGDEALCSERCLECGVVSRAFGDWSFVISDIEVEHSSASASGELFR